MKSQPKTSGQRLKHIRKLLHFSQKQMADEMDISQSTLSQIENDHYSVSVESLEHLQQNHQLNTNWVISGKGHVFLTKKEVSKADLLEELFEKEIEVKEKKKTRNAADIPLVDKNAAAGYIKNHGSPDYLRTLETYQIPGFEMADNHRIFQVEGESMQPTFYSGDFLVCEFCNHPSDFESGDLIVVISDEGIYTKRIFSPKEDPTYFTFKSDNPDYEPFILKTADIIETWKIKGRVTQKVDTDITVGKKKITQLEDDVEFLKDKINELIKTKK